MSDNVFKLPQVYTFTLISGDGGGHLCTIGKGTLKDGDDLVRELDRQFGEYEGHYDSEDVFDLPYNKEVKLAMYEGSDIMATNGDEVYYDGSYYNGDKDRYEVDGNGGLVIEGRWVE
tara:strand:+ start:288 stop:638 length:351 start_codon:yes stop_codon:yes gene_type:complete